MPKLSFKHKLVAFFLVLSLLPLAGAYWGFNEAAERSESNRVDARIEAGLRAALAAYTDEVAAASRLASALAADPELQAALAAHDRIALAKLARETPRLRIRDRNGDVYGATPGLAGLRRVNVVDGRQRLMGTITLYVPLDAALVERLSRRAAVETGDRLVITHLGKPVTGFPAAAGAIPRDTDGIDTVSIGEERYRALSTPLASQPPGASMAVVSPVAKLEAATERVRRRLLAVVLLALFTIGAVAYALGRGIVQNLAHLAHAAHELAAGRLGERVHPRGGDEFAKLGHAFNEMAQQLEERLAELDRERARLREATARFGEALAATHDPDQLLRVVVETAVEATGAAGGVVVDARGHLFQSGFPKAGAERLEIPLQAGRTSFGTLVLTGPGFDEEQRETAVSLASHATMALENARLHRIVERQALVDGLTGLANRRSAEESLGTELARADRFDIPLSVVLADLDDFKAINDTHGHAAGDAVLRAFAAVLTETLREIDLAARWGGEEFALLLPGTDVAGGLRVAERVRRAFEERPVLSPDGVPLQVTASFGVAAFPDLDGAEALLAAADEALYAAKRSGKNRVLAAAEAAGRP